MGLSYGYLMALTCSVGGIQVVWSVVLSNGTPYLLSLGLSQSQTAPVWIAAPICGLFVQPVVGMMSDDHTSRYGKRRPFLVAGTIGVVFSLIGLICVESLAGTILQVTNLTEDSRAIMSICLTICLIWTLNITIQPVQMAMRTLIIESCPEDEQAHATAWASYWTGIGNVFGYVCGFIDLPHSLGAPFITQFQLLCLTAALALILTVSVTVCTISEQHTPERFEAQKRSPMPAGFVRKLLRTYMDMKPRIKLVCHIQFFAWMAWFPLLFYGASYVNELFASPVLTNGPVLVDKVVREEAARFGSLALLLFSVVALVTNVMASQLRWETLDTVEKNGFPLHPNATAAEIRHFVRAWIVAHAVFVVCMLCTLWTTSWYGGTVLIGSVGVSWAMTLWVPFAIIGAEMASEELSLKSGRQSTGVVISLHNAAISAPQIIAAVVCGAMFQACSYFGVTNATGWVLRSTIVPALRALYLTSRMKKGLD